MPASSSNRIHQGPRLLNVCQDKSFRAPGPGIVAMTATTLLVLLTARTARGQDASPPPNATATGSPAGQTVTSAVFGNQPLWTGVGINVGNLVTGVTAKLWASPRVALQAAAGGGADGNDIRLHVDLTFSPAQWLSPDGQYLLPIYVGLGGIVGHTFASGATISSTATGFRVPVGMSVLVRGNPVELFFEVAPELAIASTSSPAIAKYTVAADGAIGFRYYR